MTYFLDSNVFMYAVSRDHPLKEPCLEVLADVVTLRLDAVTNAEVIQEILHRYSSIQQRARGLVVAEWAMRMV